MRNLVLWVIRNCRFAQAQQGVLDFDEPGTYVQSPKQMVDKSIVNEMEDKEFDKSEEYVTGFYHVTTNLPAVLYWGSLKSRQQMGGNVPGLGGGLSNQAPYAVSVTYNLDRARKISETLHFAAEICQGKVSASAIFNYALDLYSEVNGDLDDEDEDVGQDDPVAVASSFLSISRRKVLRLLDQGGLDAYLDKHLKTPKERYDFFCRLEATVKTEETEAIGLTAPFSSFSAIKPENIGIIKVEVAKDAKAEHVHGEDELRFAPGDVRIPQNPTVK